MDGMWWKILSAVLILGFLVYMWPAAKHWMKHGPKAEQGDWQAALLPIAAVVGFVVLLIMMVR